MYGVSDLDAVAATVEADYQLPVSDGGVRPDGTGTESSGAQTGRMSN